MSKQFRDREVDKIYQAIVDGVPANSEGQCRHWLRKDERHRRMHVTMKDVETAQEARLRYRMVRELPGALALLEVHLDTGRKHQIRVQLSAIGHPVVGDRKYKSQRTFKEGIALHSYILRFEHPVRREPMEIVAPLPDSWKSLL